jgi:hypothetical protein
MAVPFVSPAGIHGQRFDESLQHFRKPIVGLNPLAQQPVADSTVGVCTACAVLLHVLRRQLPSSTTRTPKQLRLYRLE